MYHQLEGEVCWVFIMNRNFIRCLFCIHIIILWFSVLIWITLILPYPPLRHRANENYRNPQEPQRPVWAVLSGLTATLSASCHKQKKTITEFCITWRVWISYMFSFHQAFVSNAQKEDWRDTEWFGLRCGPRHQIYGAAGGLWTKPFLSALEWSTVVVISKWSTRH